MRIRLLLLMVLFAAFIFVGSTSQPAAADQSTKLSSPEAKQQPIRACVPIAFGNPPKSGNFNGTTDCYTFIGAVNDKIRVIVTPISGNFDPDLEIIRPNGTLLCETIFNELTCTLDTAGTHRINVDGSGTGNYKIHVQRLNNPVGCPAITFGNPPTSGTYAVGEVDCYSFPAIVNDEIRVIVVPTSGNFDPDLEVFRPNGTLLCGTIFTDVTCRVTSAGTQHVMIRGGGTGSYKIHVQRLNNPRACPGIRFGNPPTSGTYAVGEVDCFTFLGRFSNRAVNDVIRVSVTTTSGNFDPDLEIIRPNGTLLCGTIFTELTCELDADGNHRILVRGTGTGSYKIHVQRLNNPGACPLIPFDTPRTGTYTVGEIDCFSFQGAVNDNVKVEVTTISGNFDAELEIIRPNGSKLCGTIFTELTCQLTSAGYYHILVQGSGTGSYRIRLSCLGGSCMSAAAIMPQKPTG